MYSFILPLHNQSATHGFSAAFTASPAPESDCRDKWIRHATLYDQMTGENAGALFLWEVGVNEFIYISPKTRKITGHAPEAYMGPQGMGFSLAHIHPGYKEGALLMMKKLYDFRLGLGAAPPPAHGFSASFDFMFRREDDTYFRNLQYCMEVETHASGAPMMVLNYHFDITHLKKSKKQTLVIKTPGQIHIFHFDNATQKLSEVKPITKTEVHILSLLAKGKESKQIASEICISPHTIDTHRRNLLAKLNCIDTTALITYARMIGII